MKRDITGFAATTFDTLNLRIDALPRRNMHISKHKGDAYLRNTF